LLVILTSPAEQRHGRFRFQGNNNTAECEGIQWKSALSQIILKTITRLETTVVRHETQDNVNLWNSRNATNIQEGLLLTSEGQFPHIIMTLLKGSVVTVLVEDGKLVPIGVGGCGSLPVFLSSALYITSHTLLMVYLRYDHNAAYRAKYHAALSEIMHSCWLKCLFTVSNKELRVEATTLTSKQLNFHISMVVALFFEEHVTEVHFLHTTNLSDKISKFCNFIIFVDSEIQTIFHM
jgi:hypothetical protein